MNINCRTPNVPLQQHDVRFPPITLNYHTRHPDVTASVPMICALVCNTASAHALENTARMATYNLLCQNNWNNSYFEYAVKLSIVIALENMMSNSTGSISYNDAVKKALTLVVSRVVRDFGELRSVVSQELLSVAERNLNALQFYENQIGDVVNEAVYQDSSSNYENFYSTGDSNTSFNHDAAAMSKIFSDSVRGTTPNTKSPGDNEFSLMAANVKAFADDVTAANKKKEQNVFGDFPIEQQTVVKPAKKEIQVITSLKNISTTYFGYKENPIYEDADVVRMFTDICVCSAVVKEKIEEEVVEIKPIEDEDVQVIVDLDSSNINELRPVKKKLIEENVLYVNNQHEAIQMTTALNYDEPERCLKRAFFIVGNPIFSHCFPETFLNNWKNDAITLRDLSLLMETELKTLDGINSYGVESPITDEAQLIKQIARKLTKRVNNFLKYSLGTDLSIDDIISDSIELHSVLLKRGVDFITAYEKFEIALTSSFVDRSNSDSNLITSVLEEFGIKNNNSVTLVPETIVCTSIPFSVTEMGLANLQSTFIIKPEVPLFGLLLFSSYTHARDKNVDIDHQYMIFNDGNIFKIILRPLNKDFIAIKMNA